jgi:hypothetical protein
MKYSAVGFNTLIRDRNPLSEVELAADLKLTVADLVKLSEEKVTVLR